MQHIFATGVTVAEAIKAKEELEKQGINIRVIDVHTIKPIDEEMIIKCAKETKKLISVEDHNIIGGLGSSICEVLCERMSYKSYKAWNKRYIWKVRKSRRIDEVFWN